MLKNGFITFKIMKNIKYEMCNHKCTHVFKWIQLHKQSNLELTANKTYWPYNVCFSAFHMHYLWDVGSPTACPISATDISADWLLSSLPCLSIFFPPSFLPWAVIQLFSLPFYWEILFSFNFFSKSRESKMKAWYKTRPSLIRCMNDHLFDNYQSELILSLALHPG